MIYRKMSFESKEQLRQWIMANGYRRFTLKQHAEAMYEAMGGVLAIISFSLLSLAGLSLCFGIPILTVRMVVENLQVIIKIVGG